MSLQCDEYPKLVVDQWALVGFVKVNGNLGLCHGWFAVHGVHPAKILLRRFCWPARTQFGHYFAQCASLHWQTGRGFVQHQVNAGWFAQDQDKLLFPAPPDTTEKIFFINIKFNAWLESYYLKVSSTTFGAFFDDFLFFITRLTILDLLIWMVSATFREGFCLGSILTTSFLDMFLLGFPTLAPANRCSLGKFLLCQLRFKWANNAESMPAAPAWSPGRIPVSSSGASRAVRTRHASSRICKISPLTAHLHQAQKLRVLTLRPLWQFHCLRPSV